MPQKATKNRKRKKETLTSNQIAALERLLAGETVTSAARSAGVSRETVHRWLRNDWAFQAALNRGRRELQEATQARLLATAVKAAENIAGAIEGGDVRSSLALLKGVGALSGVGLTIGNDDPSTLREEATLGRDEAATDRFFRALKTTSNWVPDE